MPLYFAYGSNMDVAAMAARCPASRAVGRAVLPHHRFVIAIQGWANVVRQPGAQVWGVLWQLDSADVPALDRYEAVAAGLYRKAFCSVLVEGRRLRALVYRMDGLRIGHPRAGYMDGVVAAAAAARLPAAYIATLAQWQPGPSFRNRHRYLVTGR